MTTNDKLNLVCDLLGVAADDRPEVIESNTRFLVGDALERAANTGRPVVWLEKHREFVSWDEMSADLADQAGDPNDPNPLPSFLIDLGVDVPTIDGILYNGVSGMDTAGYETEVTDSQFAGSPANVCRFLAEAVVC
jgi:hypothetical protein